MNLAYLVEWIRNNTQGITEAVRVNLYMLLGFGALRTVGGDPWTDAQVALVLASVSSILTLIAAKTNVSAHKVEERLKEAHAKGVVVGVQQAESGTGSGRG